MASHSSPDLIPGDLAPGDARAREVDWSGLTLVRIRSAAHPLFDAVVERLQREFGPRGEMERREVIEGRLAWRPDDPVGGHSFLYEMLAVVRGEELVAMRDHTAMVAHGTGHAVVHLSHVLVEPPLRGAGLAEWLRAFPIETARECARSAGTPATKMTLVAEMEHPDGTGAVTARLRSYERAGFLMVDPAAVPYRQPDFRSPEAIDADAIRPLPLALLIRRVGCENETAMPAGEVREVVAALYAMFGAHVRTDHMAPQWALLGGLPTAGLVKLRRPLDA